ncbi:L,D-transpeptidase [Sphingomonas segetis]|uniref:L,D-transpeptidase n=1 Tax=Sphingomonas segetis TaxID=1104779 RepID=UPI001E3A905B|nr:L,D-transpeptidase [Sphingomonas segetis]
MKMLFSAMLLAAAAPCAAQEVDLESGSVVQAVTQLKAGQYVWAPEVAPRGPMLLIVNVGTQRAVLFRNGVPIAASTVSTGRPGHATPTGVFTILQKHVEHYSSLYDNAPMPYMQRLTWRGVALHAGNLPGYPASHGCIRLPAEFAKLLYGETKIGMTVVITHEQSLPRVAPTPGILSQGAETTGLDSGFVWKPEKAPDGPVSILVSTADRRAIVIRNGLVIGSAPVSVDGPVTGTWAYALKNIDAAGQHWVRMALSAKPSDGDEIAKSEWSRFHASDDFRRAVAGIIEPGTTIIVTSDSVAANGVKPVTVLEGPQQ